MKSLFSSFVSVCVCAHTYTHTYMLSITLSFCLYHILFLSYTCTPLSITQSHTPSLPAVFPPLSAGSSQLPGEPSVIAWHCIQLLFGTTSHSRGTMLSPFETPPYPLWLDFTIGCKRGRGCWYESNLFLWWWAQGRVGGLPEQSKVQMRESKCWNSHVCSRLMPRQLLLVEKWPDSLHSS